MQKFRDGPATAPRGTFRPHQLPGTRIFMYRVFIDGVQYSVSINCELNPLGKEADLRRLLLERTRLRVTKDEKPFDYDRFREAFLGTSQAISDDIAEKRVSGHMITLWEV